MAFSIPSAGEELEAVARELSDLLDSVAAGAVDGGPQLERLLVRVLDEVEAEIATRAAHERVQAVA